jgi:prepilin-type N-terminal cleavage/methylation domain-containing protein
MNKRSGLTLVELIIVLAVLAIIGAILVPNFLNTTDRARLKSDVQSAIIIQSAIDLYISEQGKALPSGTIESILENLAKSGYLKDNSSKIQTPKAVWKVDSGKGVVVDIGACDDDSIKKKAFNQLSDLEKPYVINGIENTISKEG